MILRIGIGNNHSYNTFINTLKHLNIMKETFALEQAQELRQIVLQKLTDIETFYGITQPEECLQKMSPDEYNVYYCLHKVEGILCL